MIDKLKDICVENSVSNEEERYILNDVEHRLR